KAGVRRECGTQAGSATPESNLLEHVQGAVGEFERCKIRERTMRGKREQASRGVMPGGRPPFGYRRDPSAPGGLAKEPGEAAIVKDIFSWFLDGASMRGIASRRQTKGI